MSTGVARMWRDWVRLREGGPAAQPPGDGLGAPEPCMTTPRAPDLQKTGAILCPRGDSLHTHTTRRVAVSRHRCPRRVTLPEPTSDPAV